MTKSELIQIRTSLEDKEKLKEQALKRNLSLSDYLIKAGLFYEPSNLKAKKILISSNHIGGVLNASFTIELIDGEIAAVARFYKSTQEIKGLAVIVGRSIDEIIKLTNPIYSKKLIRNWLNSMSEDNVLKEFLEEAEE